MTPLHRQLSMSYASYRHDNWVYEMECEGWTYGEQEDPTLHTHPNLRPFNTLDTDVKILFVFLLLNFLTQTHFTINTVQNTP